MLDFLLLAVTACSTANVVTGLMSEKTGAVYPAAAKTSILKNGDFFEITLESAVAPEGISRRVLERKDGPSEYVTVDDCVFFRCGGKTFVVNFNGAWRGARPEGFKAVSSLENGLWVCRTKLPAAFCRGGKLTIGRRFAYAGPKYGRDASITLDPKTFGDPNFLPPIEDGSFDAAENPFRADDSAADRFFCKFAYYPRYHRFRAKADVKQLPGWQTRAKTVDCTILDAKGGVLLKRAIPVGAGGIADETFAVPDLKAKTAASGNPKYEVRLAVREIPGAVYAKNFYRHICEWEGNKYGLSGIVVKPFTALKREGIRNEELGIRKEERGIRNGGRLGAKNGGATVPVAQYEKVSVVLREHVVDKETGLWQQVTAKGKELLARPMALVALKSKVEERKTKDSKILSSTSTQNYSFTTSWDYDGLCEWKLTLKKGRHEPMALEIPFKASEGRLMNACIDGIRQNYAGKVPDGIGRVWEGSMAKGRNGLLGDYVPYVWIGGALRGIAVFGENDRGWVIGENEELRMKNEECRNSPSNPNTQTTQTPKHLPCQEIIREPDGTVVLRLNLVQRAVDLTEERTIRIGFQATPVKPMAENWRKWPETAFLGSCQQWGAGPSDSATEAFDGTDGFFRRMQEARLTGRIDWTYYSNCVDRIEYPGKPGSREWTERHDRQSSFMRSGLNVARNCGRNGKKMLWYMNARGVVFGCPSGATFADQWSREEFLTLDRDFIPMSHRDYELDPDLDFQDYSAWWYRLMAKSGAMDYLYWDDTYLSPNYDLVGTDAYRLPDGRIQPATGVFNMRAYIKRAACVQAELGREPDLNWIHETNAAMAPISAFAGVHYDWEDNTRGLSFQKRYPKDCMQAGAIGRQFGVRVAVIGYYGRPETPEKEAWFQRTGTGWCLAHEIRWRHKPYQAAAELLTKWGYRKPDTRVWNYWDEDVAFPVATAGLDVASLAMAREGEAVIVVSNAEDEDGEVTLTPESGTLGIRRDFSVVDMETGGKVKVANGKITVKLKGDDYAILRLK